MQWWASRHSASTSNEMVPTACASVTLSTVKKNPVTLVVSMKRAVAVEPGAGHEATGDHNPGNEAEN